MKMVKLAIASVLLAGVMSQSFAQTAALKIGVIDYGQLLNESPQGKAVQQALKNEFEPKRKDIVAQQTALQQKQEKLQRDGATLSAAEQSKAEKELREGVMNLQRKQAQTQEDFDERRNEEMSRLQKQLVQEVQGYAKQNGYDLVIEASAVVYLKDNFNITSAIMGALQTKGGKAPAAAPAAKPAPAAPKK